MNAADWLTGPLAERWTFVLLHFLWQGAAIATLLYTVQALGRLSPRSRYWAAVLALVVMACCPLVTYATLAGDAPAVPTASSQLPTDSLALQSTAALAAASAAEPAPSAGRLAELRELLKTSAVELAHWDQLTGRELLQVAQPWLLVVWLVGAAVLSLRLVVGLVAMVHLASSGEPVASAWELRLEALGARLGLRRLPRLCVSHRVTEATVLGFLRPLVLLPAVWLTELPPDAVEAVLAHELAHLRRWDLWVNLGQRIVETLLFFHPAVWWVSRRIRVEREICCDELAVAVTGRRREYAEALELVARQKFAGPRSAFAAGIGDDQMALLERVRNVLGLVGAPRASRAWLAGLLSLVVLAGVALAGLSSNSMLAQAEEPAAPTNEELALADDDESDDDGSDDGDEAEQSVADEIQAARDQLEAEREALRAELEALRDAHRQEIEALRAELENLRNVGHEADEEDEGDSDEAEEHANAEHEAEEEAAEADAEAEQQAHEAAQEAEQQAREAAEEAEEQAREAQEEAEAAEHEAAEEAAQEEREAKEEAEQVEHEAAEEAAQEKLAADEEAREAAEEAEQEVQEAAEEAAQEQREAAEEAEEQAREAQEEAEEQQREAAEAAAEAAAEQEEAAKEAAEEQASEAAEAKEEVEEEANEAKEEVEEVKEEANEEVEEVKEEAASGNEEAAIEIKIDVPDMETEVAKDDANVLEKLPNLGRLFRRARSADPEAAGRGKGGLVADVLADAAELAHEVAGDIDPDYQAALADAQGSAQKALIDAQRHTQEGLAVAQRAAADALAEAQKHVGAADPATQARVREALEQARRQIDQATRDADKATRAALKDADRARRDEQSKRDVRRNSNRDRANDRTGNRATAVDDDTEATLNEVADLVNSVTEGDANGELDTNDTVEKSIRLLESLKARHDRNSDARAKRRADGEARRAKRSEERAERKGDGRGRSKRGDDDQADAEPARNDEVERYWVKRSEHARAEFEKAREANEATRGAVSEVDVRRFGLATEQARLSALLANADAKLKVTQDKKGDIAAEIERAKAEIAKQLAATSADLARAQLEKARLANQSVNHAVPEERLKELEAAAQQAAQAAQQVDAQALADKVAAEAKQGAAEFHKRGEQEAQRAIAEAKEQVKDAKEQAKAAQEDAQRQAKDAAETAQREAKAAAEHVKEEIKRAKEELKAKADKNAQEGQGSKETIKAKLKKVKELKALKEAKEPKADTEPKEPKEPNEPKESKVAKRPKELKEAKEPKPAIIKKKLMARQDPSRRAARRERMHQLLQELSGLQGEGEGQAWQQVLDLIHQHDHDESGDAAHDLGGNREDLERKLKDLEAKRNDEQRERATREARLQEQLQEKARDLEAKEREIREKMDRKLKELEEKLKEKDRELKERSDKDGKPSEGKKAESPAGMELRAESSEYVIQLGDFLQITAAGVLPDQPIANVFALQANGEVDLGTSYGVVSVVGQTVEQARESLRRQLDGKMRRFGLVPEVRLDLVRLVTASAQSHVVMPAAAPGDYRINSPDILLVDIVRLVPRDCIQTEDEVVIDVLGVPKDSPISGRATVQPNGSVQLGGVYGEVKIAGQTFDQASATIARYLMDKYPGLTPDATVRHFSRPSLKKVSGDKMVMPDGMIDLGPAFGSVQVGGKTILEAKQAIEGHLSRFLDRPMVSVDMFAYNSKVYYMIVRDAEGDRVIRMPITGNEHVTDALDSLPQEIRGSKLPKTITLVRPAINGGSDQSLPVEIQANVWGRQSSSNYRVAANDRIVVELK
jgi:beta-lactamase regulating signal transducer with metallopeptidase domain